MTVKWNKQTVKEMKVFLKNMIDESDLHSYNIGYEQWDSTIEPYKNLIEIILVGSSGKVRIEMSGENLDNASELFNRLEKDESGSGQ